LIDQLFQQVGTQFGPQAIRPPRPVSIAGTNVVLTRPSGERSSGKLTNSVAVAWVLGGEQ